MPISLKKMESRYLDCYNVQVLNGLLSHAP